MKKITYIKTSWWPYCTKADSILARLKSNNEQYNKIEIDVIDEDKDPQRAAQYDYKLVPNMWIGKDKVLEGIPSSQSVTQVLELALEGEPTDTLERNSRYEDELTEKSDADTTAADTTLPSDLPKVDDKP